MPFIYCKLKPLFGILFIKCFLIKEIVMSQVKIIFLILVVCISRMIYPMAESKERQLVLREIPYKEYLFSVRNGVLGAHYADMLRIIEGSPVMYKSLIEEIDNIVNFYRNGNPIFVRSQSRELRMRSFDDLQDRIKDAISYKYNLIIRQ
jgi:hypothetical protein